MFKSLHVLCITVYQRIQCDCSWRWASFRNGVWSVETDGCYRLGCVGEYIVKKGKTMDKRHDGNIWNTYGYKTVWRTWGERLIRWGVLYCAEEWDFRLLGVKCQCNLLFLGEEKKKKGSSTVKTLSELRKLSLISCTISAAQSTAWLTGHCSCPDLIYAGSWASNW